MSPTVLSPTRHPVVIIVLLIAAAMTACSTSDPDVGPQQIADLPLRANAIGGLELGDDPDIVVRELTALLGGPSEDTDWLAEGSGVYGRCPLPLRVVSWGSLATFHTGGPDAGRFFAYSYGFDFEESLAGVDSRRLNLTTPEGIAVGSTVANLRSFVRKVELAGDAEIDVWTYSIDASQEPHLRGQVTGLEDDDTVLFIETSTACE